MALPERHCYVYPGHPLTLAAFILQKYVDDLDKAFEYPTDQPSEYRCPRALGDWDVPGAGGEVYQALDLIDNIRKGVWTAEQAVSESHRIWESNRRNGGYEDKLEPGRLEALAAADDFLNLAQRIKVRTRLSG